MGIEFNGTDGTQARSAARLKDIRNEQLLPEQLITLVERVLPLLAQARAEAQVVLPPREALASAEALFAGSPLALRENFPHDRKQALELIPKLLELLAESGGEAAKAAKAIAAALAPGGGLDPEELLNALASGDDTLFGPWREAFPGAPRALDFVATCALLPGLCAAAQKLAPLLPENLPHEHGACPVCGSLPYLTVLRGKEGRRMAVCSFCAHEYRVRRIACAYCDEGEQKKLKLFQVAEYPGARVDVCESCRMYVKTLDYRELDRDYLPPLDDMATVALDVLAQRQGYSRPVLSAWGF